MSLASYVASWSARIAILARRVEGMKEKSRISKIRDKFGQNPSKVIIEERGEAVKLDPIRTEEFFRQLYSPLGGDKPQTPAFNQWLSKWRVHQSRREPVSARDTIRTRGIIEEVLSTTRPWKAPGEDGIPAGVYKLLPSAKSELVRFITETLGGQRSLSERDVRGKVILIYKDGEKTDPANYRPIALLNTDYKILTGVITKVIMEKIPAWGIPAEQMARVQVSGTMHGILIDKAHTETARKNRRGRGRAYNWSGWYDFRKAYISIH